MSTWTITLAVEGRGGHKLVVEHEGILSLNAGDLTIVRDGIPVIGYARGQWLRFERKEA